jgi:hypothetical protein
MRALAALADAASDLFLGEGLARLASSSMLRFVHQASRAGADRHADSGMTKISPNRKPKNAPSQCAAAGDQAT